MINYNRYSEAAKGNIRIARVPDTPDFNAVPIKGK